MGQRTISGYGGGRAGYGGGRKYALRMAHTNGFSSFGCICRLGLAELVFRSGKVGNISPRVRVPSVPIDFDPVHARIQKLPGTWRV